MNNKTDNLNPIIDLKNHPNILRRKYWNLMWYHSLIYNIISYASIIYWIGLIIYLYTIHTKVIHAIGETHVYLPFFIVVSEYPILYFINEIISTNNQAEASRVPNVDPYYGICVSGPTSLTQDERDTGIIAKVNYRCVKTQQLYNEKQVELIMQEFSKKAQ